MQDVRHNRRSFWCKTGAGSSELSACAVLFLQNMRNVFAFIRTRASVGHTLGYEHVSTCRTVPFRSLSKRFRRLTIVAHALLCRCIHYESLPLAIELTLRLEHGANSQIIVQRLIRLGGWITDWQPETAAGPARLEFKFADQTSHDQFLKAALRVDGVAGHMRAL
jgi:hypothetical protein